MNLPQTPSAHRGMVLVVSLIFLVLLTLLGVAAMSTTSLQEKMAGNTKDQNLAFQSAETALAAAENTINAMIVKPAVDEAAGIYLSTTGTAPTADTLSCTATSGIVAYTVTLGSVKTKPCYIIEILPDVVVAGAPTKSYFRITARGTGGTDAAVAVVQSIYEKVFP